MALDELQPFIARQPAAADMVAGDVGGAAEAVLNELEVVVDAGLLVVEVLVVGERALDRLRECLKAITLRVQGVGVAIPRKVIAEEYAGDADALELGVGWIGILDQMPALDAFLADQVAHAQAEQPAEFLEPAPRQGAALGRGGGPAVLVLRIFAPDNEADVHLHRDAHRDGEDGDVLGP